MNLLKQRQLRYQNGTLERISRKIGPDVWTYRWVDHATGKRRRVQLGFASELRTVQAVKQAADGYRLQANRNHDHMAQVTMGGLLDRYQRECVAPFLDVAVGGID